MSTRIARQAINGSGIPPISAPWAVKDIIYVGVVGVVMLAALLEWILWLLAFLYCLCKAFQKADGQQRWSTRILAVFNMVFFACMRCVFLPIMFVTLPLPSQVVQYFPIGAVEVFQWFAFWSFAGLLTVPWLFCVYQLVTHNVGRQRRIKTVLDEHSAPKVVVIMPCYNEEPDVLLRTIDSIVDCEYPPSCMHIFLSFDGDQVNELYLNTIEKLGVALTLKSYPKSIDIVYRCSRITVSRFPHGGKRGCQKRTFKLIDRVYADYLRRNDNLFLLFIDSDCILDKVCIQNFMYEMELKPGSKRNMLAMTGVITSTTIKNSIITVLQDMEYIHGQLFERTVESGCGAVTCLPGALTMLRFSAFRRMAKWYFADKAEQISDLFDWGKCHLGEDRWLTHLFMIGARERYQIQMNTGAFCKTEAVQTFKSLLKQRRRWFLGFITNEVCMLTDVRLWKRYPILLVIRLAQNTIRTTALLFFIMVISIVTTSQKISNLPVGFIAVSLGLNWLLMLYFGAKLGRWKIMLYPLMFVLNPFFNYIYMVYGIFTAGNRTWGGPRADAAIKADEHTTPAEAIEKAEEEGNELLLVPETLKPAFEATRHRYPHQAPLLPPGRLEGRFAPSEALPGGWYRRYRDSGILRADMTLRTAAEDTLYDPKGVRSHSVDSVESDLSSADSLYYRPRRVESLVRVKPAGSDNEHQAQRQSHDGRNFESATGERLSAGYARPQVSRSQSEDSVSLHFGVPIRQPTVQNNKIPLKRQHSAPPEIRKPPRELSAKSSSTPATPRRAYRPSERYPHSPVRGIGISPLARKSFTRLASPPPDETVPMSAAEVIELERAAAARASLEAERRGRQRERVERYASGRRKPRKLSKQKPSEGKGGSRSSSKDQ